MVGGERKCNMEEEMSKFSLYFGQIALLEEQNLQRLLQQQQQQQQQLHQQQRQLYYQQQQFFNHQQQLFDQQQQFQNQQQQHIQNQQQRQFQNQQQEQTIDYERLTSFLKYDDSFFSPWNWKPTITKGVSGSSSSRSNLKPTFDRAVSRPSPRVKETQQSRHKEFQQSGSSFSLEVSEVESEYLKSQYSEEEASSSTKAADLEEKNC